MDTLEQYIKMCEKAGDIQRLWKPRNGDFCWHPNEGEEAFGCWEFPSELSTVTISEGKSQDWWLNWLWLPRQDQLQEMLEWKANGRFGIMLIDAFYHWAKTTFNPQPFGDDSMTWEQLWLAFVMKEKYNKVWNGKEWSNHAIL